MVANQQYRCGYELGITAAEKSPPEQQERSDENQDTGTDCIERDSQIADHGEANETECGNRDNQSIRNSKGLNVAICSDNEQGDTKDQDYLIHNILRKILEKRNGGLRPPFLSVPSR